MDNNLKALKIADNSFLIGVELLEDEYNQVKVGI